MKANFNQKCVSWQKRQSLKKVHSWCWNFNKKIPSAPSPTLLSNMVNMFQSCNNKGIGVLNLCLAKECHKGGQIKRGVESELREQVKGCGVNIKIINFSRISLNLGEKIK